MIVFLFLLAAGVSAGVIQVLISSRARHRLMDHPNERSLHDVPKPRIGGIGICAGMLAAFLAAAVLDVGLPGAFGFVLGGALVVMVISFVDDIAEVPAGVRILVHFAAAGVLAAGGLSVAAVSVADTAVVLPRAAAVIVTLLFVVWLTNLYNFMDGMDGFAGGMTILGFGTLALLGGLSGAWVYAAVAAGIAGAAAGFIGYNFPPSRVFMGDVGASTLGFLAAALALWGEAEGIIPLWLSVLVFSPFIADATVTLVRRALRRERVWRAHKTHYYQKLVELGWGHKKTVLAEYVLMAACGLSAVAALGASAAVQWSVLTFWVAVYAALGLAVHRLEAGRG